MPRLAALDLGTNSFHIVVADVDETGALRTIATEKVMLRLGDEIGALGQISIAAQEAAIEAIGTLVQIAHAHGAADVQACGTAALREAANGAAFVRRIARECGLDVEVISGEREARLIYRAIQTTLDFGGRRALAVDIGGGSVEFSVGDQSELRWATSLPLGVGRLTAEFVRSDPLAKKDRKRLREHLRTRLGPAAGEARLHGFDFMVATSGTLLSFVQIALGPAADDFDSLDGARVSAAEMLGVCEQLVKSAASERRAISAIEERRVDLMPAAAVLIRTIIETFDIDEIAASTQGLREGMLLRLLDHPASAGGDPQAIRERSVRSLARRHGIDEMHARQTSRLCAFLFDSMFEELGIDRGRRELLLYAATLHDIGNAIARKGHHKHGAYIVRHAELAGFEPEERALLAALVRYHRSGKPKLEHRETALLDEAGRQDLRPLLALLRIADGLDASREANVVDLDVSTVGGPVVIRVQSTTGDPGLDLWGARRKAKLLAKVAGRPVEIVGPGEPIAELATDPEPDEPGGESDN